MFKKLLSLSLCFSLLGGCTTPAFHATPSSNIQEKETKNSENTYYVKYKKLKKKYRALEDSIQKSNDKNSKNVQLYALRVVATTVTYLVMGAFVSAVFFSGYPLIQSALVFTSGACGSIKEILKGY